MPIGQQDHRAVTLAIPIALGSLNQPLFYEQLSITIKRPGYPLRMGGGVGKGRRDEW